MPQKTTTNWYEAYPLRQNQRYTDCGCIEETINGIRCKTPPIPPKSKIAGISLPIKEQRFRPIAHPKYMDDDAMEYDSIGNLLLTEEQEIYADRENRRICDTGYWFMCKGVITWLYSTHYFELNYWDIDAETPNRMKEYRERDRKFWMVWWQIKNEPFIVGMFNLKHRRAGATFAAFSEAVIECIKKDLAAVSFFNFNKEANKERFDQMFKPAAMACKRWIIGINNLDSKSTKFECKSPVKRKSVDNAQGFDVAGTRSVINLQATTEKGADGAKNHFQFWDEFFKLDEIDFAKAIEAQIPVVTLGAGIKKVGNIMCLSTTEEIKSGNTAYGKWQASKGYGYDDHGNLVSPTQFIPIFFSASYCLEGFVDYYGDAIEEEPDEETKKWMLANPDRCPKPIGSKRYLREEKARLLNVPNGMEAYLSFCRKHPETEEEAFMQSSGNNSFDRKILINLLALVRSKAIQQKIRRGNFEWLDPENRQLGCYWKDNDLNGRFYTSMLFSGENKENQSVRGKYGLPSPMYREDGCITVDPYSKDHVVDEKRCSLGAAHGLFFFNERNERTRWDFSGKSIDGMTRNDYHPTPSIFLSYLNRPDDVTVFHDDILKACIYYGLPCSLEANVGQTAKHFIDNGFENYLLYRYEYLDHPSGNDYKAVGLILSDNNNTGTASVGYTLLDRFIKGRMPHLGGFNYQIDTIEEALRMPFENLILDLLAFNYQKRSPHDLTMSLFTGLIYYDKLYKNRGTLFDSAATMSIPKSQGYESDILGGIFDYGVNTMAKDILAIQAEYNRKAYEAEP